MFPIFSSFHKTTQQQKNRRHKVITKVNDTLKATGIEIGITIDITRHSHTTVLKRVGISTSIISESLGHSSEKITQNYLDRFKNSLIEEAKEFLYAIPQRKKPNQ